MARHSSSTRSGSVTPPMTYALILGPLSRPLGNVLFIFDVYANYHQRARVAFTAKKPLQRPLAQMYTQSSPYSLRLCRTWYSIQHVRFRRLTTFRDNSRVIFSSNRADTALRMFPAKIDRKYSHGGMKLPQLARTIPCLRHGYFHSTDPRRILQRRKIVVANHPPPTIRQQLLAQGGKVLLKLRRNRKFPQTPAVVT